MPEETEEQMGAWAAGPSCLSGRTVQVSHAASCLGGPVSWTSAPPECSTGKTSDRQAMLLTSKGTEWPEPQPSFKRGGQGRGLLHGEEDTGT